MKLELLAQMRSQAGAWEREDAVFGNEIVEVNIRFNGAVLSVVIFFTAQAGIS